MKVTVLAENTSACGLPAEHGLSLYIEASGKKLLFDTGQSALFAENAEVLGVDLSAVDLCVLSHGHYDHGGGLKRFMELNRSAPVYMSRYAFEPHYRGTQKDIGLDRELMQSDRITFTDGVTKLCESMTLYSCIDGETVVPVDPGGLMTMRDGVLCHEDFRHEHVLLIEENGKRVLLSGCSHRGIINITDRFRPDVLIGGFHFSKLPLDDTLRGYAERLDGYDTTYYTCHCTGTEQFEFMRRYMKRLHYLSTGDRVEV